MWIPSHAYLFLLLSFFYCQVQQNQLSVCEAWRYVPSWIAPAMKTVIYASRSTRARTRPLWHRSALKLILARRCRAQTGGASVLHTETSGLLPNVKQKTILTRSKITSVQMANSVMWKLPSLSERPAAKKRPAPTRRHANPVTSSNTAIYKTSPTVQSKVSVSES